MVYYGISVYHSGWLGDVLELFGSKMLETAESNLGWQCFFGSLLTHQASVLMTSTFVFSDQSANQKLKCKRKRYLHEQVATEQFFMCHQDLRGIHTYIKDVWWSTTVLYFKLAFVLLRMFFSASFGPWPSVKIARSESGLAARETKLPIFLRDETVRGHVQTILLYRFYWFWVTFLPDNIVNMFNLKTIKWF